VRSDIRDATSKAATSFAAAGGASRAPVGERGCGVERGDMFKDRRAGFSRGGDGATVFPRRSGLFAGDRYRALSRNGDATAPSGTGGKPPAPFSTTRALCGGDAGAAAAAAFSRAFSSFFFRFGDVGGVGARVAAVAVAVAVAAGPPHGSGASTLTLALAALASASAAAAAFASASAARAAASAASSAASASAAAASSLAVAAASSAASASSSLRVVPRERTSGWS
jgi:hypothetical protein